MSTLTPIVTPILATPFGVVPLPAAAALNSELVQLFGERARIGRSAAAETVPSAFESPDDLYAGHAAPVTELLASLEAGVRSVVQSVNEPSLEAELDSFALQARAWFTIVPRDGALAARSYPLTSWCAVYCVAAPEASPTRRDSGMLRMYESRLGTMFSDATNAAMPIPYLHGHYAWRPSPGHLAVFPGSITHEVAMVRAPGDLVLVTMRCRFVAPGQQGWSRW